MKNLIILILMLLMAGCAGTNIISKEFPSENIFHYSQLEKIKETQALDNYVVYLEKGDKFPLELSLDTHIIGISGRKIDVEVKQKLFFMLNTPEDLSEERLAELENLSKKSLSEMSESDRQKFFANFMLYVSRDGTEWAPVSDLKALKKVFGNRGGTVSFGMGMSKKDGIWSYLNVKEAK